jgi:multiple sugar transport system permease protein
VTTSQQAPPASSLLGRPGRGGPPARRGPRPAAWLWPWLFVAPLAAGIAVFYLWPIVQTAWYSLTETGPFGGSTFAGLANYVALFADPELYLSLGNTLLYTVVVLLGIPIAVGLASLLNLPRLRFAALYRVLFFLPYVAMPTAIAMVWRVIFNGDFGILNRALAVVGIEGPYWISTPGAATVAVAVVGLWSSLGFNMIVLAAGLKSIPPELYEAAELDGASRWRIFRDITWPSIAPVAATVVLIRTIEAFKIIDLPNVLTNGGPGIATESLTLHAFGEWRALNLGGSASVAYVLLFVSTIACVSFFNYVVKPMREARE